MYPTLSVGGWTSCSAFRRILVLIRKLRFVVQQFFVRVILVFDSVECSELEEVFCHDCILERLGPLRGNTRPANVLAEEIRRNRNCVCPAKRDDQTRTTL